jgi:acetyl esterase/lipase
MHWAGAHYLPIGVDIKDPRLSPLRAADLSGLPPAQIHTAGFDPLRDEAKAYADALERAGVKVRYTCHQNMIHHFYAMAGAIPYGKSAMKTVGADIKAALGSSHPPSVTPAYTLSMWRRARVHSRSRIIHVGSWHPADIATRSIHVRFRGQSGTVLPTPLKFAKGKNGKA